MAEGCYRGGSERGGAPSGETAPAVGVAETVIADGDGLEAYAATVAGAPRPSASVGAELTQGALLGRYAIREVLGEGGMGRVYAAHDPVLDRRVAIKVLRPGLPVSDDARARLLREARAMAKLSHPNVITVHEVGAFAGTDFVAMELIDGETLAGWLERTPRSWREVARVFLAAGRGLAAVHAAGLVYRDFKPANVLVDRRGRVVVTDFGLARFVRAEPREPQVGAGPGEPDDVEPESVEPDSGEPSALGDTAIAADDQGLEALTATGTVMGTPLYMAPEQHKGREPDARTDQFGYCVALYEALFGKRPFSGKTFAELRTHVMAGKVAAPDRPRTVPGRLRRAVLRGLQPVPADRHPSMDALLGELERALGRPKRQAVAIAAAVAVSAAAGLFALAGGDSPGSRCGDPDEQLSGIWDEEIASRVREAFAADGRGPAGAIATAVRQLDEYAAAWRESYVTLCEATYERGEIDEEDYYLARRCLARRRSELGSLAQVFLDGDDRTVEHAAMAAQGLPRLVDCHDLASLRAGIAPPRDDATRQAVDRVRDELAEIRALWEAGRARDAEARAEAIVARARELGYHPLLAEALYQQGEIHIALAGVSAARGALEEAEFVAEVEGYDEVRTRALVARVDAETQFSSDHDAIMRIAERARAAADRDARDARLHARMDRALARIYREQARYQKAEAALEAALARYRAEEGPDSIRAAETLGELAELFSELGRFEESLARGQQGLAIAADALGSRHPLVIELTLGVARALQAVARYDEARALYDELEQARRSAAMPPPDVVGRSVQGRVVDAHGEPVEGAEIAIGPRIVGDGRYAYAYRSFDDPSFPVRPARSDRQGRFGLVAPRATEVVAIAEHEAHGRSMPVSISAGEGDVDDLVLRLSAFGRVEGVVSVSGRPPPVIWVMARPRVDLGGAEASARLVVRPGEPFVFERLPAGAHLISASALWGHSEKRSEESLVLVRPEQGARHDISLDRGDRDLAVEVRGLRGEALQSVQVLLFHGSHDYKSVGDTEKALRERGEALAQVAYTYASRPAELRDLRPGAYTICIVAMLFDFKDSELVAELAPHSAAVPVHCELIDVGEAAQTTLTIRAPVVSSLDELLEQGGGR